MITKQDIIDLSHSFARRQRGRRDRRLIHPRREWFLGLCGFVMIIVGGAGYALWLYLSFADLSHITGEAATTPPVYNEAAAELLLEQYMLRAAEYERAGGQYQQITTASTTPETLIERNEPPLTSTSTALDAVDVLATTSATVGARETTAPPVIVD